MWKTFSSGEWAVNIFTCAVKALMSLPQRTFQPLNVIHVKTYFLVLWCQHHFQTNNSLSTKKWFKSTLCFCWGLSLSSPQSGGWTIFFMLKKLQTYVLSLFSYLKIRPTSKCLLPHIPHVPFFLNCPNSPVTFAYVNLNVFPIAFIVTLNCYNLCLRKSAQNSLHRTKHSWTEVGRRLGCGNSSFSISLLTKLVVVGAECKWIREFFFTCSLRFSTKKLLRCIFMLSL